MHVIITLLKFIGGAAILIAPTMLVLYFLFDPKLPPLDQAARAELASTQPGDFVKLSEGVTYYQWHGDPDGKVVVLVHGFMVPSFVFSGLSQTLAEAGFHVLTYDQFGRGFSDRPDTEYDSELLDRQLTELLDALDVNQPIRLLGYSMGGALATIFTAHHPERVQSLALIAPAGMAPDRDGAPSRLTRILLSPGVGDWLVRVFAPKLIAKRATNGFNKAPDPALMAKRFLAQTRYDGFSEALLSILRYYPMEGSARPSFEEVGRLGVPVWLIWGKDDTRVPLTSAPEIQRAIPQAQLNTYAHFGHEIAYAGVAAYSPALITFFSGAGAADPHGTHPVPDQQVEDTVRPAEPAGAP